MSKPYSDFRPDYLVNELKLRCYTSNEKLKLPSTGLTVPQSVDAAGRPIKKSIFDYSLGPMEPGDTCDTCGLSYLDCTGHYGSIDFVLPLYNPCFFPELLRLLRRSCMSCHCLIAYPSDKVLLKYKQKVIKHDRLDLASRFDHAINEESGMKNAEYWSQYFDEILARENFKEKENTEKLSKNATFAYRLALKSFESKIVRSGKTCPNCFSKIRSIRHDQKFKIFYTQQKTKSKLSQDTLINSDEHDWRNQATQSEAIQTYFSPIDVRNHLTELWRNDKDILSAFYGLKEKDENASSLLDLFMLESVLVVPPKFRPLNSLRGMISENAESTAYNAIIHENNELQSILIDSKKKSNDKEVKRKLQLHWMLLQRKVNGIYESQNIGRTALRADQFKGVKELIEKKEGILRKNIMGKRVDFAGRSVISPDPYLATFEIGVPEFFAKSLDYPEAINKYNFARIYQLILRGPNEFPGAKYIKKSSGAVIRLRPDSFEQRKEIADSIKPNTGCLIYRHLDNGDYLMINRQPTLHRPSFMGHVARVLKNEKVMRLHYSNCKSYNADFDGDELNLHFPQDEQCRVEIAELMLNTKNYIAPKDGTPLGGLIHDHIVSSVKMTCRSTFFERSQYQQLVVNAFATLTGKPLNLLKPCILKPKALWSGKQVISTIILNLRSDVSCNLNISGSCKISDKDWQSDTKSTILKDTDPHLSESIVVFREGHLLKGVLDKNHIGSSPYGLIHCCQELYGGFAANRLLSCFSRVLTFYLQHIGFTLGTEDVAIRRNANLYKKRLLQSSRSKAGRKALNLCFNVETSNIDVLKILYRQAHRNPDESHALLCELDAAYKTVSDQFQSKLTSKVFGPVGLLKSFPHNNLHFMISSGAKGSKVNAMQMSCLLGQQELEGRRPPLQTSGSSLPCFAPYETSPSAGGFIFNSFSSGLRPHEYFFHCMAGREGLVDTAVKTSRSGYLQRCLIKHLEGIGIEYDMTVRDSDGALIQFIYGEDGIATDKTSFLRSSKFNFFIENHTSVTSKCDYAKAITLLKSKERINILCEIRKDMKKYSKSQRSTSAFLKFEKSISAELDNLTLNQRKKKLLTSWGRLNNDERNIYSPKLIRDPFTSESFVGTTLESISEKMYNDVYKFTQQLKDKQSAQDLLMYKVMTSIANPGESVGMVASQSVGEPSTQMTLNTFHFAGRGEMNVTLGIPRLREILMSASENQNTPMAQVPILPGREAKAERLCKRYTIQTFREIVRRINIDESCVVDLKKTHNNFVWVYKIRVDFLPAKKSFGSSSAVLFENRLIPIFISRIIKAIKESAASSLIRAVVAKNDVIVPKYTEENEEGNSENFEIINEFNENTGADDEFEKLRNDDEVSYDGEENEEVENEIDECEESDVDNNDDTVVQEVTLECIENGVLPVKRKAIENSSNINLARIRHVLSLSEFLTDYTYCPTTELWSELTLTLNARNPRVDVTGILDNVIKTSPIRPTTNIKRSVIIDGQAVDGKQERIFQTEGIDLQELMNYPKVFDLNRLTCNSIHEMAKVFGIEAAGRTLIKEIVAVFSAYGINVDYRHLSLLADYMTYQGKYSGFNRLNMVANPSSLQKMSFETAFGVIKESVLRGDSDFMQSPSSCIFVGQPARLGTGFVDLIDKNT
ncbi:hypothetical protein GJ496_011319 [Pomphorhynchus laevis]|nr:hypothetical protein GJ496_011319 [Pomphorhynchus laevis]